MINFQSTAEMAAEMDAPAIKSAADVKAAADAVAARLEGLCWKEFDAARRSKEPMQNEMLDLLRARNSLYTDSELKLIADEGGGSRIYAPLTQEKITAAVAWAWDLYLTDRPYSIDPSPMPELEDEVKAVIAREVEAETASMMRALSPSEQREYIEMMQDRMLTKGREYAQRRALANEDRVEDELVEGRFYEALRSAIDDGFALRAGCIKGPTPRMEKRMVWSKDGRGATVELKAVRTFSAVSPFDLYPAPGSSTPQQGHISERMRMTLQELVSLKGVEGFKTDKIDEAITTYGTAGTQNWWWEDSERRELELRGGTDFMFTAAGMYDVIEHHTFATGKMLREWGVPVTEVPDEAEVYSVVCWMLGRDVLIGARLNPDPLDRRPYATFGFRRMRNAFWSLSVGDIISDIQKLANAAARSIANNMAMAAGGWIEWQVDRIATNAEVEFPRPYSVHQTVESKMGLSGPAINYHQPQLIANSLIGVYSWASSLADTALGLPGFMSGTSTGGGAGDTSSGLAQLREMASRTFKATIVDIDAAVKSIITNLHAELVLLEQDKNPMLTGDIQISAKGSSAFGDRQQQQVRLNELVMSTNNPTDLALMKPEGRAELLRQALKSFDGIELDRVIPSREKIIFDAKEAMAASMGVDLNGNPLPGAAMGGQMGGMPRTGRATMPDGSVQGDRGQMA